MIKNVHKAGGLWPRNDIYYFISPTGEQWIQPGLPPPRFTEAFFAPLPLATSPASLIDPQRSAALYDDRLVISFINLTGAAPFPENLASPMHPRNALLRRRDWSFAHIPVAGDFRIEFFYEQQHEADAVVLFEADDWRPIWRQIEAAGCCLESGVDVEGQRVHYTTTADQPLPHGVDLARRWAWGMPGLITSLTDRATLLCVRGVKGVRFSFRHFEIESGFYPAAASGWLIAATDLLVGDDPCPAWHIARVAKGDLLTLDSDAERGSYFLIELADAS